MKTSNFYQLRNLTDREFSVSIALYTPKYVQVGMNLLELAPDDILLEAFKSKVVSEDKYIKVFNKKLDRLNASAIYKRILEAADGREPVLMCHCGKSAFCHRHLVADWFEKNLGIEVSEFGVNKTIRHKGRLI